MPNPPKCFRRVTTSQLMFCIFLHELEFPQRKLRLILSSSKQTFDGRRLHCIRWVGITEVIELMSMRRPAKESDLAFQPESLDRTLFMT